MMVSKWQIVEVTRTKGKIEAIKLVRESERMSLMQAKDAVEAALDGIDLPLPAKGSTAHFSSGPSRHRKAPTGVFLAIVILLLVTVGCLSACFVIADSNRKFCDTGEQVTGEVVNLVSTGRCKAPVIGYQFDGESHLYESSVGSNPAAYGIGEEVSVVVDPASPNRVMIDDIMHRWAVPIIFGVIGFATGFGATVVIIVMRAF